MQLSIRRFAAIIVLSFVAAQREADATVRKPPGRRWLQFSLRDFLIAITLLALWLGSMVNRHHRPSSV